MTDDDAPRAAPPRADWTRSPIIALGRELGFQEIGIADTDLDAPRKRGCSNGSPRVGMATMDYMARHGVTRARPGGARARHAARHHRADELPARRRARERARCSPIRTKAFIVALRARPRLSQGAARAAAAAGRCASQARSATSAIACSPTARRCWKWRWRAKAGLGWRGKHTLLLTRDAGSWFFLGEIYTDLPLPVDAPVSEHCGTCSACIDVCPTRRDRRALRARRAALHLLSDDRASRAAFPRRCGR